MKTCSKCQQPKPLTEFFPDRRGYGDGYRGRCRDCLCRAQQARPDKRSAEWRKGSRARSAAARGLTYKTIEQRRADAIERGELAKVVAAWRTMDLAIRRAAYRLANPIIGSRQWYAKVSPAEAAAYRAKVASDARATYDPAKAVAKVAAWRLRNPGKLHKQRTVRRNRKEDADDGTLTNEVMRALYANAHDCPYCDKPMTRKTLDHMIPLARGGMHSVVNAVIACQSCNCSKRMKTPLEYIVWRIDSGK